MKKRVAVIGASSIRRKYGNKAVRAFRQQGYDVFPVNPNEAEVEGLRTYASILDVPEPLDMVTFYVPPSVGVTIIDDVAKTGVKEVWLNPGSESQELIARARSLGLEPILACSVMAIGERPGDF